MLNYIDRMELPQWYDENMMKMIVVNPKTTYLYWELSFGQWKALHGCQLLLNLYELPFDEEEISKPQLIKKIPLPPLTDNWYFENLQPAHCYQADMSWEKDRQCYRIIRSNIVELPPATPFALPRKVEWLSAEDQVITVNKSINQPTKETMQDLIDSMSFYMGINKVS